MSQDGYTDDAVLPFEGEVSSSLVPAEVGVPAQYLPAQYYPASTDIPAEPREVMPLQPAQYYPASPDIPAEPREVMPLEPFLPAEVGMPAQYMPVSAEIPAEPLEPRQYIAAQPLGRLDDLEPTQDEPALPWERGEEVEGRLLSPLLPAERREALPLGATGEPETPRYDDSEPEKSTPRFYKSTKPGEKPAMLDREALRQPGDDNPPNSNGNPPTSNDDPPNGNENPPGGSENPPGGAHTGGPGGSVFVDTEKLSQAIPGLDGIMRRMYAIGNGTANALNAFQLDRGDSYGEAYVKTADPISSQILEGLSNAGGVFGDTAEGASLMVHNYTMTEENAVDSAGGLLAQSGEK